MNPRRLRTLSPIVLLGALLAIALVGAVALVQATDNKPGIVSLILSKVRFRKFECQVPGSRNVGRGSVRGVGRFGFRHRQLR